MDEYNCGDDALTVPGAARLGSSARNVSEGVLECGAAVVVELVVVVCAI